MAIPSELLHGIKRLDPLPITLRRLVGALNDERMGPSHIGQILEFDQAASSSLLRMANSAAYGGWSRTETVQDAVVRLGKAKVLDIVMGNHLKKLSVAAPLYELAENELWLHSATSSLAVRALMQEVPRAGIPESAIVAALVHDIGKLVMVRYLKADVSAIQARRKEKQITFVQAEREIFGCDHAEVGGEVARHWGFPDDIRVAITRHHDTPLTDSTPALDAVVVANLTAKAVGTGLGAEGMDIRLDEEAAARLKLDFTGFSRICMQTMLSLKDLKSSYGLSS